MVTARLCFAGLLLWSLFTSSKLLPSFSADYRKALHLSLLFYEAQRSGHLPPDNRIPWRKDSTLEDKGQNGEDLTGGYFDASDYIKFSFTMAFTTTMLSWGVISYEDGYRTAGEYERVLDAIKWASDYFIKCHVSPNEFYGQVGELTELNYWGRPEDLVGPRPAYKIDEEHPGTDLAGEAAAALAATSLVFKHVNETYSTLVLKHAEELFHFADKFRGLYQEAIPVAKNFYENSGYGDELAWSSIWLYRATNNKTYLESAEKFYETFRMKERPKEFFFNKKLAGIQVLLAQDTGRREYKDAIKSFCKYAITEQERTPRGLIFIDKLGTLSHAANIAFVCLQAADIKLLPKMSLKFAKQQIDYMLGASGRSYLVGYGSNYPKQPHHSASSCPDIPQLCGQNEKKSSKPNPQILYGALVSGPNINDYYLDKREEFLFNDVTLDYNAGFQGVLAALIHYENFASELTTTEVAEEERKRM